MNLTTVQVKTIADNAAKGGQNNTQSLESLATVNNTIGQLDPNSPTYNADLGRLTKIQADLKKFTGANATLVAAGKAVSRDQVNENRDQKRDVAA